MKIIRRSGQFFFEKVSSKPNSIKPKFGFISEASDLKRVPLRKLEKEKMIFFLQKNVLIFLFSRFPARLRPTVVKTLLNANLVFPPLSHIMQISFRVNNKKVCLLPTLDSIQRNETPLKCYPAWITQWIKFLFAALKEGEFSLSFVTFVS